MAISNNYEDLKKLAFFQRRFVDQVLQCEQPSDSVSEFTFNSSAFDVHSIEISAFWKSKPGEELYLVGSSPQLGEWNMARAVKLQWTQGHIWRLLIVPSHQLSQRIEFKFIKTRQWEPGPNHVLDYLFCLQQLSISPCVTQGRDVVSLVGRVIKVPRGITI